jgi:hypothetical protein
MIRKPQERKRVSYPEIAQGLNQALEAGDPMRLEGLQQLQRVREIKGTQLQREHKRLSQKLGADHPRVVEVGDKLEINRMLARDVATGVARAQTPTVRPDANSWTLHGHVHNRAGKGVPKLTITLVDDKKKWIEEAGHACTGADGYFRLTVKMPRSVNTATDIKGARDAAAGKTAPENANSFIARDAASKDERGVFIHVANAEGHTLYLDDTTLAPKLGEVVYREIVLDTDAGCECAPPGGKEPATEGRYLGNLSTHELHDLNNTKARCQIDEIKDGQRQYFSNQKEARAAGYDFCAYCFGKDKSKR